MEAAKFAASIVAQIRFFVKSQPPSGGDAQNAYKRNPPHFEKRGGETL